DVTAITTREPKRDDHLRSADFFDVAKYPTITFKSTKIEKAGGDKLKITGELTMRGVTKTVVLDAEGPSPEIQAYGMTKTGFSATTKLNRKDFGVAFGKTMDNGGAIVGDEVNVQIDIEFNLHKDEPAKK
ncbi:MAG: YceI family protein, partial [Deltaproteobacteria bacterium]|nr:YceI family protein [Deltaproteobacteria bacterium]